MNIVGGIIGHLLIYAHWQLKWPKTLKHPQLESWTIYMKRREYYIAARSTSLLFYFGMFHLKISLSKFILTIYIYFQLYPIGYTCEASWIRLAFFCNYELLKDTRIIPLLLEFSNLNSLNSTKGI